MCVWADCALLKQKRTGGTFGATINCLKTIWELIWELGGFYGGGGQNGASRPMFNR